MTAITYADFECVGLRVGIIIKAEEFLRAKNPSFKIWVGFWLRDQSLTNCCSDHSSLYN
jgi:tRNA-binding EMAP/Myf-like protein